MVEVKQRRTPNETVSRRLRNSGDTDHVDTVIKGERTPYHNIHLTRNKSYGEDVKGNDIFGQDRGPANRSGEIK